jgi:hypothetical protein
MKYVTNKVCHQCGKANTECVEVNRKVCWLIPVRTRVCQSCVSKIFRGFNATK